MTKRDDRGVALVIAVFALTVIGALVAAAFFAATQEHRMSDASRRQHQANGAAESAIAAMLRQWPDAANELDRYPAESLVLGGETVVIRRVGDRVYLVAASQKSLGMLIVRPERCVPPPAEGVEMTQRNCQSDSILQKAPGPRLLPSRAWVHVF